MSAPTGNGDQSGTPTPSGLARASRGFVLVFVGSLLFFAFVIGSELLGAVGQSVLAFVFASAALVYLWRRVDPVARRRFTLEARQWLRPSSRR
jgi:Flp pilus assembly protein TadB